MKKLVLYLCAIFCLLLALVPAAGAVGGGEGWIQINCNVDGASVSFDGVYQGLTSGGSLTVPVYTTGAPFTSFTVDKAGYTSYSGALTMPSEGQTLTFYATLNPIATPTPAPPTNYGSISVSSSPPGAQIYFNGNYRGTAPLAIYRVYPGTYTITADLYGYGTYTAATTVYAGSQSTVLCQMTALQTYGSLYVISDPTGSNVYLDSIYKGTTPVTLDNLASGTHIVQLDHFGYYDWKSTVNVPVGGTSTVSGTLNPMPAGSTGWVYVSSSPGGASVSIDGKAMGQTPASGALRLSNVATGDHTVTLSLAGYQQYSTTTNVVSNTVSEVSVILPPDTTSSGQGSLSVSSTPAGANVFLDNNFVGVTPFTLPGVSAGSHTVTIQLGGYQDFSTQAQVNAGATSTVAAALSPGSGTAPTQTQYAGMFPALALAAFGIAGFAVVRRRN